MLPREADDRGVSEGIGVATLVLITVLVTASVGMSVLVGIDGGEPEDIDGEFRFEQLGDRLVISYERGPALTAGNLYADGPHNNVSWAAVAEIGDDDTVTVGDTMQIGALNIYGSDVEADDDVEMVYLTAEGERVIVDRRFGEEDADDTDVGG